MSYSRRGQEPVIFGLAPPIAEAIMNEAPNVARRRQFCALCGQLMFEYFRSPDGHFGLVNSVDPSNFPENEKGVRCQTCGARYRLLERLNAMGAPVERR